MPTQQILSLIHILEALAEKTPATLCKNTIEEYMDENGCASYLCEALIDMDGKYELVILRCV